MGVKQLNFYFSNLVNMFTEYKLSVALYTLLYEPLYLKHGVNDRVNYHVTDFKLSCSLADL